MDKILQRFANPYLPDTVDRVGRQPLRKLSRSERLIGPAAELAERGVRPRHLLATVEAALSFDVPEDPESVELQQLLRTLTAAEATERITGLQPADPLYADVLAVLDAAATAGASDARPAGGPMAEPRRQAARRADQRRRRAGHEPGRPGGGPHRAQPRRGDLRRLRGLAGARRGRRPHPPGDLGRRQRHPEPRRHRDRHRPLGGVPRARGPAPGRPAPPAAGHRPAGRDRRRRQPVRGGPAPPGMAVAALRAAGRRHDRPGDRRAPPGADDRRPGRVDRQRHARHRHDHRGRLGAAPHRRGRRRDRLHRGEPSAQLRGRGDGPALWLPGADGRHRRARRLRADPRVAAGAGLGAGAVRDHQERPRGRPAPQHRHRRRGRPRLRQPADHQRVRAPAARGAAGRGRPADHSRARPARRRAQRLRPVDELHPRARGRRGGPGRHAAERPAADRAPGQPGGQGAPDGVRRPDTRAGRADRGQRPRHRADDARRRLHRDDPRLPLHLPGAAQRRDEAPCRPDRPAQRRRARTGHERRRRGRGPARTGPRLHHARDQRQLPRPDGRGRAGAAVGRRRGLERPRGRRAGDQPACSDRQGPRRHRPRPGGPARERVADHRRLGRVRGGAHHGP